MMEVLLESPWIVAAIGIAITLVTLYVWLQTGRKEAMWGAVAVLVLTGLAVLVSHLVETPQEKLRARIHAIANDLENNRREAVLAAIHPAATETVQRAEAEMPNYRFKLARVTRIQSMRFQDTQPKRAIVEMSVVVDVETNGFNGRVPRYVEIVFIDEGGTWLVYDYRHADPINRFRDEMKSPGS